MKVTERAFKDLVRERRDTMLCPPPSIRELLREIREELEVLDGQAGMMEEDDEVTRMSLARLAALVLEADVEWFRA
jgi:hypothetical protein